ncbi:uncharacterized protein ACNS7B_022667 isoform 1-T2 [Menidia menidia]
MREEEEQELQSWGWNGLSSYSPVDLGGVSDVPAQPPVGRASSPGPPCSPQRLLQRGGGLLEEQQVPEVLPPPPAGRLLLRVAPPGDALFSSAAAWPPTPHLISSLLDESSIQETTMVGRLLGFGPGGRG